MLLLVDVAHFIDQVILSIIIIIGMTVFVSEGEILLNPDQWATEQATYVLIASIMEFGALALLNRSRS